MPRISSEFLATEYLGGKSLAKISTEFRIPERTLASRLRKFGVLIRPSGRPRKATTLLLVALNEMKKESQS